jgi:hypothetical protein
MTPKFTRTKIPEKETLGERLAKKRAALGIDIKEAERATKIRAKHIELLENGDYDKLPPDVYVRGFLKNYANFLKLDQNKVLKIYLKERGLKETVKKITSKPAGSPRPKRKSPKTIITPRHLVLGGALLSGLAVFIYIGWQISILAAPPKLEIISPKDNSKATEQSIVVEGKTDAGAEVFINDVGISIDPEGNFVERISLQEGVNVLKITSKNKLNKVTQSTITVLAELKSLEASTPGENLLEMSLEIGPRPNSVLIEIDGQKLSTGPTLMAPGTKQTLRAKGEIILSVTDGGSATITLNGKALGALGRDGQSINSKVFNINSI